MDGPHKDCNWSSGRLRFSYGPGPKFLRDKDAPNPVHQRQEDSLWNWQSAKLKLALANANKALRCLLLPIDLQHDSPMRTRVADNGLILISG